jgi:hypothetical protein
MPAHQLAVGSLNAVSPMHGFGEPGLSHFFAPLLDQIMAQSNHQDSAPIFGTGTLFLHQT